MAFLSHINFAGDGGSDESGAVFLQPFTAAPTFSIGFGGLLQLMRTP
jgi:hypothetical protein